MPAMKKYEDMTDETLIELIRAGQARRATTYHSHLFTTALSRDIGLDEAFLESVLDNVLLDIFNSYRSCYQTCVAGALTGRRAHMGGELREIIGFIQAGIGEVVHTTID